VGPGHYTLPMLRQQLAEEWRECLYTVERDPDSESDNYDPTRECFNIDGAVVTMDDTEDATVAARAPAAGGKPRTPQVDPPPRTIGQCNLRNCAS
jgi:hypothetical protein